MKNLKLLSKEEQDLLVSVYLIGHEDGQTNQKPFNNHATNESKIEYLDAILNPETEECQLTLIDSVS